jgi:glutathione S-transferase
MMMWSAWAMNQIEPHASQAQYHGVMLPEAERIPALVTQGLASVQAPLAVLEGALVKGGGTLVGGRFTVADLNMACVMFYLRFFPQALAGKPAIKAWYDAAMARPANRAAFALRGE